MRQQTWSPRRRPRCRGGYGERRRGRPQPGGGRGQAPRRDHRSLRRRSSRTLAESSARRACPHRGGRRDRGGSRLVDI